MPSQLLQHATNRPWMMRQRWEHLLFMHQPASKQLLKLNLPPMLELDTFDGEAWIGIIPFQVSDWRLRGMPAIPYLKSYLEVNVRTYVKHQGVSGVYFFSLDANLLPAVIGARTFSLPYHYADMELTKESGRFSYFSHRKNKSFGNFEGNYRPVSEFYYPDEGTLVHWFVERYILWTIKGRSLLRGDIHHKRWKISNAEANIKTNTLTLFAAGNDWQLHYASPREALLWALRKV
ncbi:YqjF family protein [Halobacillus seohaensis]|uniref:YqjF family protein n=1 Tax=Halobacillus seohaensis TaxID=447421 RepID=A0ABW2EQP4_9BACI